MPLMALACSLHALHRWSLTPCRAITPQGQLISESGTMSGGGGKPRGGKMALGNAAPREVDARAAQAELAKGEQACGRASEQLKQVGGGRRAGRGLGLGLM